MELKFIKVREDLYRMDTIVSLRKSKKVYEGSDGVTKTYVMCVQPEAVGNPENRKLCSMWLTEEEGLAVYRQLTNEDIGEVQWVNPEPDLRSVSTAMPR